MPMAVAAPATGVRYNTRSRFDPDKPTVVMMPFTFGGREFAPGEPFLWRGVCLKSQAAMLYRTRRIDHPETVDAGAAAAVSPPQPAPAPAAEAPRSGSALKVKHRGFGRWAVVDRAGNIVQDHLTRQQADRLVAGASGA